MNIQFHPEETKKILQVLKDRGITINLELTKELSFTVKPDGEVDVYLDGRFIIKEQK